MDSEDDEDGEALLAANEFYPYNDVRIEGETTPNFLWSEASNILQNFLRH